ncbi:hypothetical protein I6N90_07125 [Paenibacillus sp. GSMTC-2017]|uniref:hypothetical protein n=1 Tax=Paenibacillus sp. GSMTC-2017 TaxID=2794350 RepID=UPI0018D881C0|nr:hypothetical protein [Paenibacillus sp. GSMTC-2017]MBH5317572.1 hypothetical protein [Paenibacillus sp. GSMTC-2017]
MLLVYAIGLLLTGLFIINAVFAYQGKHIDPAFWSTVWYQFKLLPLLFAANVMIGYGIKFTYKTMGSLTFSLVLSKGIELLVCVLIGFIFLKEVPNWKTAVGLIIVMAGVWITKLK